MKNYKILLSLVLTLFVALSMFGCSDFETDRYEKNKKRETKIEEKADVSPQSQDSLYDIYLSVVKKYRSECDENHSDFYIDGECPYCSWAVYDIDGNGVKELIVQQGSCETDKMQYVFEAKNGKAEKIGEYEAWHLALYEGKNEMIGVSGMSGEGQVSAFTIVDGEVKIRTVKTFSDGFPQYPNYITFNSLNDLELLKTSLK